MAGTESGGDPDDKASNSALISKTGTAMFRSLVGGSEAIHQLRESLRLLHGRLSTVLVQGESGTGKELVARHLHYHSGRKEGPFVAVNCSAITVESFLLEVQRHEGGRSADAGAGMFERARGGSLFLDMIDTLPRRVQPMLLRLLEHSEEEGEPPIRLIAATHVDLAAQVKAARFRADLYHRLNVFPIEMPPLRERREDIPELLMEAATRLRHRTGVDISFDPDACSALQRYHWPGNLRELANLVERLSVLMPGAAVGYGDLPASYRVGGEEAANAPRPIQAARQPARTVGESGAAGTVAETSPAVSPEPLTAELLKQTLAGFEKDLIEVALRDCSGNMRFAAEHLQVSPGQLDHLMKKHGISV